MSNSETTPMDAIKEIKSELEEILDFADRRLNIGVFAGLSTPSKDKLMRLIELVEEAQVEKCAEKVNRDAREFVINSDRVTQQLTEKE